MAAHHDMGGMTTTAMSHMAHNGTTMDMGAGGMGEGGMGGHEMPMPSNNDTCPVGMQMFFHTGKCEYILFEKLRTTSAGEMVGACFVIFALALLYEGLKVLRETLLQRTMVNKYSVSQSSGQASASQDAIIVGNNDTGVHMMSRSHAIQTCLHVVQVFISYCLMLVFMSYNVWLCIAVLLGAGTGYFLFGWKKAVVVDMNEHCH